MGKRKRGNIRRNKNFRKIAPSFLCLNSPLVSFFGRKMKVRKDAFETKMKRIREFQNKSENFCCVIILLLGFCRLKDAVVWGMTL